MSEHEGFLAKNAKAPLRWIRGRLTERGSLDELAPGEGAVVTHDGARIAAYRDPDGELQLLSATCTHRACIVEWNAEETTWDCPCHGSRFATDGEVLNGPAKRPLGRVEPESEET